MTGSNSSRGAVSLRVAIVAGETSGDYLGAEVMAAIRARWPHVTFEGIAGPRMQAAGAVSLHPMEALSVRGYVEVLRHLPRLLRIRRALVQRLRDHPPALFIGIDAPDFNLGLARRLKTAGIPAVQCVAPTVWAWRAGRLPGIRAAVDAVLAVFPFEPSLFRKAGISTTYIGHPLAAELPDPPNRGDMRDLLRLPREALVIALLPGSRVSELQFHARLFVDTARALLQRHPEARFLVPLATRQTHAMFNTALWQAGAADLPFTLMHGHATQALTAADLALVASGTATLEAALCGCPMVVTYRLSALTAWLVRRRQKLAYLSLPNILAGTWLVPELLQEQATVTNLVRAMSNLINDRALRKDLEQRFRDLHAVLKTDSGTAIQQAVAPWLDR